AQQRIGALEGLAAWASHLLVPDRRHEGARVPMRRERPQESADRRVVRTGMAACQQRTGDAAGQGLDLPRLEVHEEAGNQGGRAQVDHGRGKEEPGEGVEPVACRRRLAAADLDAAPAGARERVKGAGQEVDAAARAVPVAGGEVRIAVTLPAFYGVVEPR